MKLQNSKVSMFDQTRGIVIEPASEPGKGGVIGRELINAGLEFAE